MTHRPLLTVTLLAGAVALLPAGPAAATKAKRYPSIKAVTPMTLGVGDTLTLKGANFRAGAKRNTVVLKRDGGRAIFLRVTRKATTGQLSVTIPAKLLPFLAQREGKAIPTRFRLRVLASRFGKAYTPLKTSPRIGPVALAKGTKDDCDGDGVLNNADTDDDNDLLADTTETQIGTNPCARDTDGDGMSDGWEYQSALDRNNASAKASKPSPNRKPYANPLNKEDGGIDQDGDGLTNLEEYAAWATFSNVFRTAPAGGSVLTYSGGNPTSDGRAPVPPQLAYMDHDGNGFLSDLERDADGDHISNVDEGELAAGARLGDKLGTDDYGFFSSAFIDGATKLTASDRRCAGINQVPYFCTQGMVPTQKVDPLDWLATDTDGDGTPDDADDQDHDGVANLDELLVARQHPSGPLRFSQLDACLPNADSFFCLLGSADTDHDGILNRDDSDDDGDLLPDAEEAQLGTDPLLADTDADGISDGFEVRSARDLNDANVPYPGKRPYPNALDGTDADKDFDQDVLTLREEYQAWQYTGGTLPYTYSDGEQYTGGRVANTDPSTDYDGNGLLSDDEKDVDHDGLSNYVEAHGPMLQKWWTSTFQDEKAYPGPAYLETSFVDADTDGDGIPDGADDQDHDGYTNAFEQWRPSDWATTYVSTTHPGTNPRARVNPFNPCKPTYSDACHRHPPIGYYEGEDWESPFHVNGP